MRTQRQGGNLQKKLTILGSTGSIGTQTLMVCRNRRIQAQALVAGSNVDLLARQAREFLPRLVVIEDENRYKELKTALADTDIRVAAGRPAVIEAAGAPDAGMVVNAIVGSAGLRPTLAALEGGNPLALANKEAIIAGGELVMAASKRQKIPVIPIDSEHSAIFQCLRAGRRRDVRGVILTASGGPFAGKTKVELGQVEPKHALAHPNWSMGAKITIDSATLMNKGLEFIEAMWLFGLSPEQIQVVVHRQSVIHSAVEYADGSVIAQLGTPDMRTAIQYAVTYPSRYPTGGEALSLTRYGSLTFEEPDLDTFTCLATCIKAAKIGGLAPCIANGANEEAVRLFLQGQIPFLEIGELVARAVEELPGGGKVSLDAIEEADRAARAFVLRQADR